MTFQQRIPHYVAAFAALLVAAGFAGGVHVGLGAIAGAIVALVNAFALRWLVTTMLRSPASARSGATTLVFAKSGLIFGLSAIALFVFHVDPVGFAIGVGALVLGLVVGAAHFQMTQASAANPAGGE